MQPMIEIWIACIETRQAWSACYVEIQRRNIVGVVEDQESCKGFELAVIDVCHRSVDLLSDLLPQAITMRVSFVLRM